MQEQEFKKLLDKYLKGSITDEEKELLENFKRELQRQNTEPYFASDIHKKEIKESLWLNIQTGTSKEKLIKIRSWSAYAAAAVFIGFVAIGYFYLSNTPSNISNTIPENVITLQLQDGTIKVVDETRKVKVLDAQGKVVGQQEGASLKYSDSQTKQELAYNTLKVPYGKTFKLQLSDGTTVHLNAGSSIKYPIQFIKGLKRAVLITGEAYLDVAKDAKHPFIVNTNDLNIQVLGTQFNVSAYPEDETVEVVLVEGSVNLYTESEGYNTDRNIILEPGFKGSFDKNKGNIYTSEVITSIYTSWINGKLVFRNMTFKNILKKLERCYDVTIINNNHTELMNEEFNANFGDEPIEKVLEELKTNYGVKYKFLNNKIIID